MFGPSSMPAGRVTEVEPAPECPDSVFVEDTVVVYGDLAVIARSGAVERRPETQGTEKAVAELGYRIAHIEAPGVLVVCPVFS